MEMRLHVCAHPVVRQDGQVVLLCLETLECKSIGFEVPSWDGETQPTETKTSKWRKNRCLNDDTLAALTRDATFWYGQDTLHARAGWSTVRRLGGLLPQSLGAELFDGRDKRL